MRRLNEIQERGIRRRLAMLIQRGREGENIYRQRHVPWQGQDNPRGVDVLQQFGNDSSHFETFWFPGQKVVIERKRQPGYTHVSQTLYQIAHMADHPDVLELSADEVRVLQ
jgi:hypothetical protein